MPTDSFPQSSSVHVIGNAGLDLGRGSGNVWAVSPHWTPWERQCMWLHFSPLWAMMKKRSPNPRTDEHPSVTQHKEIQQAPAESLPRKCTSAMWHLPTQREVTRVSPAMHAVVMPGWLLLQGSFWGLCSGNPTALSSWRPAGEILPRTLYQEKLCFYWGFIFVASLFYLLDTVITLTGHISSLLLESPGTDLQPSTIMTLDIIISMLMFKLYPWVHLVFSQLWFL